MLERGKGSSILCIDMFSLRHSEARVSQVTISSVSSLLLSQIYKTMLYNIKQQIDRRINRWINEWVDNWIYG